MIKRIRLSLLKRLSHQSITVKIISAVLLVYCLIVGVGAAAMMSLSQSAIAHNSITTALYQIQIIKIRLVDKFLQGIPPLQMNIEIHRLLKDPQFLGLVSEINILSESGNVLFSSNEEKIGSKINLSIDGMLRAQSAEDFYQFIGGGHERGMLRMLHTASQSGHCALCKFNLGEEKIGGIEVYLPLVPIYARFTESRITYLMILVGILGAGIFLIRWIVHRLVKSPIDKVVAVMEQAKEGKLGARTSVSSDPDLRKLAESFNSMASSIQNAREELEAQHQRELSQSNRLASLGQLISNVSHEIRNPLTAITSALHVLKTEFEASGQSQVHAELILQISRIEQTVNHLLRYARQAPAKFQCCEMNAQIDQALNLARHCLQEKKIEVAFRSSVSEALVLADQGQLQQVFLNLFLNAAGALSNGGVLTIRIDKMTVAGAEQSESDQGHIVVKVQDSGAGIKPEDLPHIFEPFFTTKPGGTGLGLPVVKDIMKAHHGSIEIKSEYGKGTEVFLFFPIYQPEMEMSNAF